VKKIQENHILAASLSLLSISLNLIWNFFFFTVHFQLSIQGEFLQYLSLPAFWYFVSSFSFESRLFIIAWRSQLTQAQIYNETFMRRRLTIFYLVFYAASFTLVVLQQWFLHNPIALILFNSTLWIPQIVRNYMIKSRKGPPISLAVCLTMM